MAMLGLAATLDPRANASLKVCWEKPGRVDSGSTTQGAVQLHRVRAVARPRLHMRDLGGVTMAESSDY